MSIGNPGYRGFGGLRQQFQQPQQMGQAFGGVGQTSAFGGAPITYSPEVRARQKQARDRELELRNRPPIDINDPRFQPSPEKMQEMMARETERLRGHGRAQMIGLGLRPGGGGWGQSNPFLGNLLGNPMAPPPPRPYGGGPGFAKPLSPPPSTGGGGGGQDGGPPTSWKMSIEPMAYGGLVTGYQDGGHVPLVYANGGYIPAYGLGGWLKKAAKGVWKGAKAVAPIALGAINPALGAGVGALIKGIENKSLKSALMGGMTGYLGGKALSKGFMAASLRTPAGEVA